MADEKTPLSQALVNALMKTWPARMGQGILGSLMYPGDVYQGNAVVPSSDNSGENIGRATDLAGLLMSGSTGAPRGALGSGPVLPVQNEMKYPMAPRDRWYGDANYEVTGGKLATMTPDEFLAQARPMKIDDVARENINDLKKHIQNNGELDPLAIYKNGKEDGRHRAIASKELGITQVPVLTWGGPK